VSLWPRKPSPLVVVLTLARAHDLPRPMIWLEDDGAVSLDWDVTSDAVLSVTLSPHGRGGGWSAIIGEWVQYDRFRDVDRSDLPSVLHRFARAVSA
jgi:hypothetical protein